MSSGKIFSSGVTWGWYGGEREGAFRHISMAWAHFDHTLISGLTPRHACIQFVFEILSGV